jgi:hypothetical protein
VTPRPRASGSPGVGYSALKTTAAYLPFVPAVLATTAVTQQAVSRIGARPVLIASRAVAAAGMYWTSRITERSTYANGMLGPELLLGLGLGPLFVLIFLAGLSKVNPGDTGVAFQGLPCLGGCPGTSGDHRTDRDAGQAPGPVRCLTRRRPVTPAHRTPSEVRETSRPDPVPRAVSQDAWPGLAAGRGPAGRGPGRGASERRRTADFEQLEPERLDLREHAIQRGAVGERPGQRGHPSRSHHARGEPACWQFHGHRDLHG